MRRRLDLLGVAICAVFIGLFYAYPLVRLFTRAFSAADTNRITDVLTGADFADTLWFSVWQATVSTLLTFIVGLPAAATLARFRFRGRGATRALITMPFVLPTVVAAGAFRALFDRLGIEDALLGTVWAILAAHVFFNVAVVVRLVGDFWRHIDPAGEQAARVLGASPLTAFRLVTLPLLRPALAAAAVIVFLFTFTSFGVILILGDGLLPTIETEIWRYGTRRLELDVAAALAVVQLIAVAALAWTSTILQRRSAVPQSLVGDREGSRPPTSVADRAFVVAAITPVLLLVLAPLVVLVARSVERGRGWSLSGYRELAEQNDLLGTSPLDTIGNSLRVSAAATVIAVVIGTVASMLIVHGRKWTSTVLDTSLLLPLGTSAVTLGFGLFLAFDQDPLAWRSSWWMLPTAHALIGIPFVVRSVVAVLRSIDGELRAAARTLGASPGHVFRTVDLPVAGRGIAVGGAFAFAVSMGEFGATSMLPRARNDMTAPLAIFRLLGTPGQVLRTQAFALAVVLLLVVLVAVIIIDRLRPPGGQGGW